MASSLARVTGFGNRGTAARAVDRIAVLVHPGANLAQPGGELLLDRAVRLGAYVQQEVPVVPRRARQILDQLLRGLELLVRLVIAPGPVDGVARLQGQDADFRIPAESHGVLAGQVFLEHLEVLALERWEVMVVSHQRRGLELVNQVVRLAKAPVGVPLIPDAIEPNPCQAPVPGQQFGELRVHEIEVAVEVAAGRTARILSGSAQRKVVRIMPVQMRVVEEQFQPLFAALFGQRQEDVFAVGRGIHDVPLVPLRAEHGETVVVLAGDGDVAHARGFRKRHPLRRVVLDGVELRRQLLIFGDGHTGVVHDPLALTEDAVDAPVDEHAELGVLKPAPRGEVLGGRLVWRRLPRAREGRRGGQAEHLSSSHGSYQ